MLTQGKLFLADIRQEMLDYARKRLIRNKIYNVEFRLCNGTDMPFAENLFDMIFMVTVLGEIEKNRSILKSFIAY